MHGMNEYIVSPPSLSESPIGEASMLILESTRDWRPNQSSRNESAVQDSPRRSPIGCSGCSKLAVGFLLLGWGCWLRVCRRCTRSSGAVASPHVLSSPRCSTQFEKQIRCALVVAVEPPKPQDGANSRRHTPGRLSVPVRDVHVSTVVRQVLNDCLRSIKGCRVHGSSAIVVDHIDVGAQLHDCSDGF